MPRSPYIAAFKAYSGGTLFGGAMRRLFRVRELPTTVDAIDEWLRSDLSWTLDCNQQTHLLRLHDGRIEIVDHDWADLASESMLAGLSDSIPACLDAWSAFETGRAVRPREHWQKLNDHVLLRGACAWAGIDIPADDRGVFINAGTTPQEWQPWAEAGIAVKDAAHFLAAGVSLEAAMPWIEARMVSKDAAQSAARGEQPTNLDFEAWKAHGFSRVQARNWTARVGCTPAQARQFVDLGAGPYDVQSARGSGRPLSEIADWARAGIPTGDVQWWMGLPLDQALRWSTAGVPGPVLYRVAGSLASLRALNQFRVTGVLAESSPAQVLVDLDPDDVAGWLRLGIDPYDMAEVIDAGFESATIEDWGGLPEVPVPIPYSGDSTVAGFDLADLLTVTTAMDKPTWQAWVDGTSVAQWNADPTKMCAGILTAHDSGVSPAVYAAIPDGVTHGLVRAQPMLLAFALIYLDDDPEALHRLVGAGWMQDALIAPTPRADSKRRVARMAHSFEVGYTPERFLALDLDELLAT